MYLQKPKKGSSKTNLNTKIHMHHNQKEQNNKKAFLLESSNRNTNLKKYFIMCRSCFWYYSIINHIQKGTDKQYSICPLCANKNIEYLSIPNNRLFKYISAN